MKIPFELAPGLVADDTDFSNGGYKDASGVRFWRGKPETVRGWESLSLETVTGVCRTVFGWNDPDNLLNFAFGEHDALHVWQNGELADITPASGFTAGQIDGTGSVGYGTGTYGGGDYGEPSTADYFPLTWSFGSYEGQLIACPRNQSIFLWANDTGTPAAALTNAPEQNTYVLSLSTRQVMALGTEDESGGAFNPSAIRWSDVEDATDWTTAASSNAGEWILEGGGRIVAGKEVGGYVLVWTTSELHIGSFDGGWTFQRVAGNCGLAGPNAVAVAGQDAFWITPDLQFMSYSLGGVPQVMVCPIRDDFADNAAPGQNDKIVAATNAQYAEVRWFYADQRDGTGYEISRDIRFSRVDGAWSRGTLARTAFVDSNPAPSPVGVTYEGNLYWHERGESADGGALEAFLETGAQYLDPAQNLLMLRGLWPDFKNQTGPITLTVYSRMYPQDDETTWGPYTVAANGQKVDFRATGRLFRFRFESDSAPMAWRMGKPVFDAEILGER